MFSRQNSSLLLRGLVIGYRAFHLWVRSSDLLQVSTAWELLSCDSCSVALYEMSWWSQFAALRAGVFSTDQT